MIDATTGDAKRLGLYGMGLRPCDICGGRHGDVAVLFAARKTAYRELCGVEVYDIDRDARTFAGGMPIVAHPPCKFWSRSMSHMANGDRESDCALGLWAVDKLKECGGVLEQPSGSLLFETTGLPKAGYRDGDLWTIGVFQSWWGYPIRKPTWLCFSRIDVARMEIPCGLSTENDKVGFQRMGRRERAATTPEFAQWLVDAARMAC